VREREPDFRPVALLQHLPKVRHHDHGLQGAHQLRAGGLSTRRFPKGMQDTVGWVGWNRFVHAEFDEFRHD